MLTRKEVAKKLKVTTKWVYEHSTRGAQPLLPVVKIGKHVRYLPKDVEEFIQRQRKTA